MEKNLQFKAIVEYERSRYDKKGLPLPELDKENKLFLNYMTLDFMNFDKLQKKINDKVLKEATLNKYQKVRQILIEKDAIMNFNNSFTNYSI